MSAAVAYQEIGSFKKTTGSNGVGQDSTVVSEMYQEVLEHILETTSESQRIKNTVVALRELYGRSQEAQWDGQDGVPISENTYRHAKEFIWSLPSAIPMPDILAEPNGEIGFEWYVDPFHVFVASLSEGRTMTYAGLFGMNKTSGQELFLDSIPMPLVQNIRRLGIKR